MFQGFVYATFVSLLARLAWLRTQAKKQCIITTPVREHIGITSKKPTPTDIDDSLIIAVHDILAVSLSLTTYD